MSSFRECLVRSLRTFFQAALGYAAANLVGLIGDGDMTRNTLAALLVASVAAGAAAVMNLPGRGGNDSGKEDSEGE